MISKQEKIAITAQLVLLILVISVFNLKQPKGMNGEEVIRQLVVMDLLIRRDGSGHKDCLNEEKSKAYPKLKILRDNKEGLSDEEQSLRTSEILKNMEEVCNRRLDPPRLPFKTKP